MGNPLIALSFGLVGTLLLASLLASPTQAQGHGGHGFAPRGRGTGTVSRGHASGGHFARMRRGRHFAGSWFGPNYYPYYDSGYYPYDSSYYPDYDYQDESGEEPPPFRAQAAAPAPPANASKAPEALVMELRGDHWVRLTSYGPMAISGEGVEEPQPGAAHGAQAPRELPPAVLVFRDGHQEEVAKYTIVGTTITIKADYWSTGSWTRKILIADLDLAATLQANQERGAKFSLPSRPSEVMVR